MLSVRYSRISTLSSECMRVMRLQCRVVPSSCGGINQYEVLCAATSPNACFRFGIGAGAGVYAVVLSRPSCRFAPCCRSTRGAMPPALPAALSVPASLVAEWEIARMPRGCCAASERMAVPSRLPSSTCCFCLGRCRLIWDRSVGSMCALMVRMKNMPVALETPK